MVQITMDFRFLIDISKLLYYWYHRKYSTLKMKRISSERCIRPLACAVFVVLG